VDCIVKVETGEVQGLYRNGVAHFRGIPYATAARFAEPGEPERWTGVRDATRHGPICPQPRSRLEPVMGPTAPADEDEDCLTLSVATPAADGARRPVMVWIHGGAYVVGAGSLDWYAPDALVGEGDVVVVSINYRLGVFGYLRMQGVSPGNLGVLDQMAALAWVGRNIAAFGGDPENVTVFGQSAGGHSIATLLSTTRAKGLFRRAIVQSAHLGLGFTGVATAALVARGFQRALSGSEPRSASVEQLSSAQEVVLEKIAGPGGLNTAPPYGPIAGIAPLLEVGEGSMIDSTALPDVDLLIGTTRDEMRAFFDSSSTLLRLRRLPRFGNRVVETINSVATSRVFSTPARKLSDARAAAGASVYTYRFDWAPPIAPFGACHTIELPFVFGSEEAWRDAPMLAQEPWWRFDALGRKVRAAWTRFARSGDPNSGRDGREEPWPKHRPGDDVGRRFA
jgi:para-nitrobenzyl esterase